MPFIFNRFYRAEQSRNSQTGGSGLGLAIVKKIIIEHEGEVWATYDLIILDIILPGISGFEICQKIRAVKNIPILFVSAKKEDIDKIGVLGLGADDYITKPFSPSELVARVKAHITMSG